jgi:hypothetical protein
MEFLIPIVIVPTVFGCIAWIAYVILEILRSRQRIRAASELQGKLIERLSGQDIGMFLTSENGSQLLRALAEQPSGDAAHMRILRALQAGLVLVALGVGVSVYTLVTTLPPDGENVAAFFAIAVTALGIGLLLAAGASYYMSKSMGLLKSTRDSGSAPAA